MTNNKIKDTDYLGLTSMLRSRQAKMLDSEKLERLVSAADFSDAARQLAELGYPDMSGIELRGIDGLLSARRSDIFADLARTENAQALTDLFRVKYDYHNIKLMVKSANAVAPVFSGSGRIPPEKMADAFARNETDALPEDMRDAIAEAQAVFARTGDAQLADISVDKAYFARLLAIAGDIGSDFLTGYVRLMIDSANLRTAVRAERIGKTPEFLRGALIEGGTVRASTFAAAFAGDSAVELFSTTRLALAAELGRTAVAGGPITAFERECDNAVSDYLSGAALVSFGAAPVAAYLAHLENEITSVRIILTGKLSGSAPATIRERLRHCHV